VDAGDVAADDIEAAVDWQAFVPTDVADHLATMDRAARDSNCGVPWQLLAAIARVESDFGRNMATSSAGAIGYGQFLPSSWQTFGSEGNAYDYRDALPAIALYLCKAGLERDPRAALFAYNHADWYVDLVLDLAARYDRMAPGAPTPDVLDVGPSQQAAAPMNYGPGRDLRLQSRGRWVGDGAWWLGVSWRGRTPGQAIAPGALEATTLSMLRAAFAKRGDAQVAETAAGSQDVATLAGAAWDAGFLTYPGRPSGWTTAELRQRLRLSQPVVIYVGSRGLPGHPPDEDNGEQPLVLIGANQAGFVYNDPSFSSSLGYGLEMSETDLLKFWDAATRQRQALAFAVRPDQPPRQAHIAQAEPPEPLARVAATATAIPSSTPTAEPSPTSTPMPVPTSAPRALETPVPETSSPTAQDNPSWAGIGLTLGVLGVAAAVLTRRLVRPS
jgi:hypothetical protein